MIASLRRVLIASCCALLACSSSPPTNDEALANASPNAGGAAGTGAAAKDAAIEAADAISSEGGCVNAAGVCYSTHFALNEQPISEDGAWKKLVQATDSTWTDGDPGMGFYREANGTNALYGFWSYSAQAL